MEKVNRWKQLESLGYHTKYIGDKDNNWTCVIMDGNGKEVARGWNLLEAMDLVKDGEEQ